MFLVLNVGLLTRDFAPNSKERQLQFSLKFLDPLRLHGCVAAAAAFAAERPRVRFSMRN